MTILMQGIHAFCALPAPAQESSNALVHLAIATALTLNLSCYTSAAQRTPGVQSKWQRCVAQRSVALRVIFCSTLDCIAVSMTQPLL